MHCAPHMPLLFIFKQPHPLHPSCYCFPTHLMLLQGWLSKRLSTELARNEGFLSCQREWEVRGQQGMGSGYVCMYVCSSHCPPNELHAITSMHECTPLECGDTWNTFHWQGPSNLPSPRTGGESVWPRTWEEDFFCFKEDLQLACIVWYTQPTEWNNGSAHTLYH